MIKKYRPKDASIDRGRDRVRPRNTFMLTLKRPLYMGTIIVNLAPKISTQTCPGAFYFEIHKR